MHLVRAARGWTANAWKWGAGSLSAGAALVSLVSYAQSKVDPAGAEERRAVAASATIRWLGIAPLVDTLYAIGDTAHLAAMATDTRGNAVVGAATTWSSADTSVAKVDAAGLVVARGPGTTTVVIAAGSRAAQARVVVRQRADAVRLVGDSVRIVSEGDRVRLEAQVVDARGHAIAQAPVNWRSTDVAVAAVDSAGGIVAVAPGRATLSAVSGELSASVAVNVVPVPQSITVAAGENQRAAAGRALPAAVVAQVVSRGGRPIQGVAVRFAAADGGGQTDPAVDTTDARGMARTAWTLGATPGRQRLTIGVEGVESSPVVVAEADPVAANTRVAVVSDSLSAQVGEALAVPAVVRVTDSAGVALADVPVAWSVTGGGTIAAESPRTDSLGEARARWTLGPKVGIQRASVRIGNPRAIPPAVVTAVARAGAPAAVALASGGDQHGPVGKPLKRPVVVRVADRGGNPVAGVSLAVAPKAGSVPDSVLTTNAAGEVQVPWTLGRAAGNQRLMVRLAGSKEGVEVAAQAQPLGASNLTFVAPPSAGIARKPVAKSVNVEVADAYGNPVSDQLVELATHDGSVKPRRVMTDARGRAAVSWTLGSTVGTQSLAATAKGTDARATLSVKVRKR